MKEYFGIRYKFDKASVMESIDQTLQKDGKGYICVADGVILSHAGRDSGFRSELNASMFSICDSGWVPLYVKIIYGEHYEQYSGSQLFADIINRKKYVMMFLGGTDELLQSLRSHLSDKDPGIAKMHFISLPFCDSEEFNFREIANRINAVKPDIIWVGLGAPKQEQFMYRLHPFIDKGVMIGIGAVFKFYSGINHLKRAPNWMIYCKIEWLYRLFIEPEKQFRRIVQIVVITPFILFREFKKKKLC